MQPKRIMPPLIERIACAVCEKKDALNTLQSVPLSKLGFAYAEPFELLRCTRCDHIFQRYVPRSPLPIDETRSHKSQHRKREARLSYFMENARKVEKASLLLGGRPHDHRFLDFGMGWGFFLLMARAYGHDVQGVEIDADRIAFARERGIESVRTLQELTGGFSFIQADQVLEHLNEPLPFLKELTKRLHNDGILYLNVPNGKRITYPYDPTRKVNAPLEHVNCFSPHSLEALARRAGLSPIPPLELARTFFSYSAKSALSALTRYPFRTERYFRKA